MFICNANNIFNLFFIFFTSLVNRLFDYKTDVFIDLFYLLITSHSVRPDVVRLGEQNLVRTDDKANPKDFGVADVIAHPDYRTSSHYSDIAVVKLADSVRFNKFIRPACLWQNYDVNSTRAVATGWGQVEFCEFLRPAPSQFWLTYDAHFNAGSRQQVRRPAEGAARHRGQCVVQHHVRSVQAAARWPEVGADVRRISERRQGHVPGWLGGTAAGADAQEPVHFPHSWRDVVRTGLRRAEHCRRVHTRLIVPGLAWGGGLGGVVSVGAEMLSCVCDSLIVFIHTHTRCI